MVKNRRRRLWMAPFGQLGIIKSSLFFILLRTSTGPLNVQQTRSDQNAPLCKLRPTGQGHTSRGRP